MPFLYLLLDLLAIVITLFTIGFAWRNYEKLPDKIPTHFDFEGKPDAYGTKKMIFLYPVLNVIFTITFLILLINPEHFNYPVEITPENQQAQYDIALVGLRILLLYCLLLLLNFADFTVRVSADPSSKPRVGFFISLIYLWGAVLSMVVFSYIYQ